MWVVYVLHNAENKKIYIGQTKNLRERLIAHNKKQGKHYTARYSGEWKLVYKEEVSEKRQVLAREKQLKSYQGRQSIKKYIPL